MASSIDRITEQLGDEADSLLTHTCSGIPKEMIHAPGPTHVDDVFVLSDRNTPTLVNLQSLLQSAIRHEQPITHAQLKEFKKERIEGTCQGMVEFVEPKHTLEQTLGQIIAYERERM